MQSKEGFLKDKFGGMGAAPADGVWDNIATSLDAKERKKRVVLWWFTGMAAGIFALVMCWTEGELSYENTAIFNLEKPKVYGDAECVSSQLSANQLDSLPFWYSNRLISFDWNDFQNFQQPWSMPYYGTSHQLPDYGSFNNWIPENIGVLKHEEINKLDESNFALIPSTNELNTPLPIKEKKQKRAWFKEVQLYSGRAIIQKVYYTSITPTSMLDSTGTSGLISAESSNDNNTSKSLPISVNFMVGKEFGRFEFMAGLGVNYFNESKFSNGSKLTDHHFGLNLPLVSRFNFVDRKRSKVFLELGGNLEIPLFEKDYQGNNFSAAQTSTLNTVFGIQFGLKSGIGYRYVLNEKNSISVSPEVRYYFTQKNAAYSNITQPRWWFGANIAFRF